MAHRELDLRERRLVEDGARYFQLRLLFENNALSSRSFPVWDVSTRS